MKLKSLAAAFACALAALAAGCGGANETTNTNTATNANTLTATGSTTAADARTAPDNSEIRMETVGGVTTETRTFRDPNSRVERVVVTTRDGRRTARVYYRDRTVRELPDTEVGRALDATGDALVSAGGTVVDASKAVGSEIGDKAEDVGDKAASGAKKAGKATVKGAKKAGGAIKDAVTP